MSLGVHLAITPEQCERLLSFSVDEDREAYVEEIERDWDERYLYQTEKAWHAIHCCLTGYPDDSQHLDPSAGKPPLNLCMIGGRKVLDDEAYQMVRLIEPDQVIDVSNALTPLDREWLAEKYRAHCKDEWAAYGELGLEYTWEFFYPLKEFFQRIALTGRAVLFVADM